jgi:hypothetical protein
LAASSFQHAWPSYGAIRFNLSNSQGKQDFERHDLAVSRRLWRPSWCRKARPRNKEGAGKTGCWPLPMARLQQKKQAAVTTGSAKSSGLPCAMVLRFPARSPRGPGSLAPVIPEKLAPQERGTSVGAPGPHAFSVRVGIVRPRATRALRHYRVHRIPHPRFVTIGRNAPLHRGGTAPMMLVIWGKQQQQEPATDWHDGQFSHGAYARSARRAKSAGERLVLLPSPRAAVGRGWGWGWLRILSLPKQAPNLPSHPPPPTSPRHARRAWREGDKKDRTGVRTWQRNFRRFIPAKSCGKNFSFRSS